MIKEGLILMLAGMSAVMLFLGLLVMMMHAGAAFFRRYADRFADTPPEGGLTTLVQDQRLHIAIAAAAIHRYLQSQPNSQNKKEQL